MYLGIDNGFVLENIFGNVDIFRGAQITNINWQSISGRMKIDIETQSKASISSKKVE